MFISCKSQMFSAGSWVKEFPVWEEWLSRWSTCCGWSPLTWHCPHLLQRRAEKHFSSPAARTQRKPLCPPERRIRISTLLWSSAGQRRSFAWCSSSSVSMWESCRSHSEFYVWMGKNMKTTRATPDTSCRLPFSLICWEVSCTVERCPQFQKVQPMMCRR